MPKLQWGMNEIDQIKLDEGFKAQMYKCPSDKWTIGYGFNLESGITEEEASLLLTIRVNEINKLLRQKLDWLIYAEPEVKNVLTNMAYQIGITGLLKFKKTLKYLKSKEYGLASMEMIDSKWFDQTPERAKRLADRIHFLQSGL